MRIEVLIGCNTARTLVAAIPLLTVGCVVPIGPSFDDPSSNYPPFVESSSPLAGAPLVPMPGTTPMVEVVLGDQNLDDLLYARWLYDYPPYDPQVSLIASRDLVLPPTGNTARDAIRFSPNCADMRGAKMHRLTLAVSDRPFAPISTTEGGFDTTDDRANLIRMTWILDQVCP